MIGEKIVSGQRRKIFILGSSSSMPSRRSVKSSTGGRSIFGRSFKTKQQLVAYLIRAVRYSDDRAKSEASFLWNLADLKELVYSKDIDPEVLESIVHLLTCLPHMLKESRTIGATVIIGSAKEVFSYLQIPHPASISEKIPLESERFRELADLMDPSRYAFVIDSEEHTIHGVRALAAELAGTPRGLDLLPTLTEALECVAFCVKKGERNAQIYVSGTLYADLILSEQEGRWVMRKIGGFLSQFKNEVVSRKVLERVVDVALELTYRGYGGLFFVGRRNDDLKTDPPRFPVNPGKNIIGLDKETLVDLAKQDGATIVDEFGNLAAAGVTLRPADAKIPKAYRGRTRHAAAYLASSQSKGRYVVVVSQNRTLCVFEDGRKYVL